LPEPGLKLRPLAPHLMRNLWTTKTTERIDCSQAIELFRYNGAKHKTTKPNLRATLFQQSSFFGNIVTCMDNHIWQFFIFTGVGFTALSMAKT